MKSLFLFIGFGIGVWLNHVTDCFILPFALFIAATNLAFSYKKGSLGLFIGALLFGFLFSLIGKFVDTSQTSLTGIVMESKNNYFLFQSGFSRYYVYCKNCSYEIGDILKIEGKISEFSSTNYEGYFSFKEYLSSKGVDYQLSSSSLTSIFSTPIRLKEKESEFLSSFTSETSSFLNALLFNQKDYDSSFILLAQSLSLLTLFSNSGMIYSLLLNSLHRIAHLALDDKNSDILRLCFATLLLPLSFFKIGILRVYLTLLLSYFNSYHWKRRWNKATLISTSGIFLGLLDYHYFYQQAFLIGYLISLSLFFFHSYLRKEKKSKRKWETRAIIFAFILPFSLSSGSLHPFFYLYSIFLLPLLAIISFLGYLSFFSVPFVSIFQGIYRILFSLLNLLSRFDITLNFPKMENWQILLYYLILIQALIFYEIGMKKLRNILYFGFLSLYVISFLPFHIFYQDSISFINVGQGDSILIQDNQYNVMIDTGGNTSFDMAEEVLIPYLYSRRVYHIDYLITTHDDADHAGAKDSLMEHFEVRNYLDDVQSLEIGSLHFENLNIYGGDDENDQSIVFYLEFMKSKWLFMGDASTEIENKIIAAHPNLKVDYLKVGHHGSKTSSSYTFLKSIAPKEAIISVGEKNSYGHPSEEVLSRLEKLNITIRRTDLEGTITYQRYDIINL